VSVAVYRNIPSHGDLIDCSLTGRLSCAAPAAADAGALVPHESKPTEPATEAGTIIHMERATQKIEHDKIVARAKAWEDDTIARIESRSASLSTYFRIL